ncbi:hypothetical protein [Serratia microhaemolytica]|nr:hypothetical protein [Serratia microhaemolytica]
MIFGAMMAFPERIRNSTTVVIGIVDADMQKNVNGYRTLSVNMLNLLTS